MKNGMNLIATFTVAAMLAVMSVAATTPQPVWNVDKSVTVTGDYVWNGASWTLPNPAPMTATYQFQGSGVGYAGYQENEALGMPWIYSVHNNLVSSDNGAVFVAGNVVTVNPPVVTPATGGYTQYAFGVQNLGKFTTSTLVVTGFGSANIAHNAAFTGNFQSSSFFCVNDQAACITNN